MFETGIRQFRMAMSMVWGKPVNANNIHRLIEDALKTLEEFGTPGDDVQQLLDGPFADPAARKEFQNYSLRRTVVRLARVSPYYQKLLASQNIDPKKFSLDDMPRIPVTLKQALQEHGQAFITSDSRPYITTRTTGRPTAIWLSKYEFELWYAMAALSGLLRNEIGPSDCYQINISSRATAAVEQTANVCRLVGARVHVLGVIPPDESLDCLLSSGDATPTLLTTYPSYLAHLVKAARRRKLGPYDFHLRRIDCGGEVLSNALMNAAKETFGARQVNDAFGMTEVLPVSGRVCSQGHLHHDLNMGYVEIIGLEDGLPAAPGELGTLVITPYYPYRQCMPVLRYDTRDIVRCLTDEALSCELAAMPASSNILGKATQLLHIQGKIVPLRDLVEVIEALPSEPWPARFSARVVNDSIELVLPEAALSDVTREEIVQRFHAIDIPVRLLDGVPDPAEATQLRPLRADLLETTFTTGRN